MESPILLSTVDDEIAAEKGRILVAQTLAHDPEQRRLAEDRLGRKYCRMRWPEAYSSRKFFRNIVDLLTFKKY